MNNEKETKYLKKLYRVYPEDYSIPFRYFEGKLVNQNNKKFYFERLEDNALIIIEHSEIYKMYPIERI